MMTLTDSEKAMLDGRDEFPDPASRFQPEGPHGPSQVIDPGTFPWTDQKYLEARAKKDWRRTSMSIYEAHLGSWRKRADGSSSFGVSSNSGSMFMPRLRPNAASLSLISFNDFLPKLRYFNISASVFMAS